MRSYLIRIPTLIQKLYSNYYWQIKTEKKELFLTFDDGPTPEVTAFVLDTLQKYNAKATFFCIGKNIKKNPSIFKRILNGDHMIGNHTNNHLNGWKTDVKTYIEDVLEAQKVIDTNSVIHKKYFRPAYGRITKEQSTKLREKGFKIIMWSLLSGDFDTKLATDKCYQNCIRNIKNGDIIVLHDSLKSYEKLKIVLPKILQYYQEKGFVLKSLDRG